MSPRLSLAVMALLLGSSSAFVARSYALRSAAPTLLQRSATSSVDATDAPITTDNDAVMKLSMDDIVSLCKRRGFIFPSSEIYNGYAGFYDYGPLGAELKKECQG